VRSLAHWYCVCLEDAMYFFFSVLCVNPAILSVITVSLKPEVQMSLLEGTIVWSQLLLTTTSRFIHCLIIITTVESQIFLQLQLRELYTAWPLNSTQDYCTTHVNVDQIHRKDDLNFGWKILQPILYCYKGQAWRSGRVSPLLSWRLCVQFNLFA
jgi:hypothetical protein